MDTTEDISHASAATSTHAAASSSGLSAAQQAATLAQLGLPEIVNVVATVNLGLTLDLKYIAMHARNAQYTPNRFSAMVMRIRDEEKQNTSHIASRRRTGRPMKATALVFATGKLICTGTKGPEEARAAAKKFAKIIRKILHLERAEKAAAREAATAMLTEHGGQRDHDDEEEEGEQEEAARVRFDGFKVQNMVAKCDCRFPIRLEALQAHYPVFSTYEPELFPGLVFRMAEPRCVVLCFVSGKLVITGAKSREQIQEAFDNICDMLKPFRK
ncbi:TATA-box-binding protein [Salpingoeca rosetta]|uniref:TATA-box-binding protein n=1 Tax=Salpingoeca rosetta (strain ATCC 50818 / BSB-021) TaxID=946362 RepID=F2UKE3_SALR5|nr:TATA-box-binding protein [Salpingoeca rosetta]EGD77592.1 TATA-box-binding protein [Salpingoeca rosetta]|eukprot:XP_004990480.1 TATA-box-binding protein [Salpingoeca rosetta]